MGEVIIGIIALVLIGICLFGIGWYAALLKVGKIMRKNLDNADRYSDEFQMGMFKVIHDILDNT